MYATLWAAVGEAVMITGFVSVMMVGIEYLSVITEGSFQRHIGRSRWSQYLLAGALGAVPGCLGPFTVVALYSHRVVGSGALVAAMIATSGDEAFVMLALFPREAIELTLVLAVLGVVVGATYDLLAGAQEAADLCPDLVIHRERPCKCFAAREIAHQWHHPTPLRSVAVLGMGTFVLVVVTGVMGPSSWDWIRVSLALSALFGLFVVSTVPDHFLEEHIWQHVVRRHVPSVLGWTVAALLGVSLLEHAVDLRSFVHQNVWAVLGGAALVGVIPESGPHLVFVTMFHDGTIPASILVTSSIVQDGHGMLPLLAESRRVFLRIKMINVVVGLAIGSLLLSLGA